MVYVGAIIILFLFSLVFLDFRLQKKNTFDISLCILVFIALGYFLSINLDSLFIFLKYMQKENSYLYSDANYDYFYIFFFNDVNIFISLYTKFSVLLLTVAFILLIVMIGSVSLCLSLSKKNNFKTNKPFFFNFNY